MTDKDRFACPCCGRSDMSVILTRKIAAIERALGYPVRITSGFRCEAHNRQVGGSPTSSHLKGLAADVACNGSRHRYHLLRAAMDAGFDRIGVGRTWLHLDVDKAKDPRVIWVY